MASRNHTISIDQIILAEYFGFRQTSGDIGIEIEVEGTHLPKLIGEKTKYWRVVQEGSLRDGIEYVLTKPIPVDQLDAALKDFANFTRRARFKPSIRTSVHVHKNASDLTLTQIYAALTAYWIVENSIVALNGPNREGNLFCLRGKDCESFIMMVTKEVRDKTYFSQCVDNEYRYSAVNLSALRKFGSLEFRFIKGTTDTKEIGWWTRNLNSLVEASKKLGTPLSVLELFYRVPLKDFLNTFFDPTFTAMILEKSNDKKTFTTNIGLLFELGKSVEEAVTIIRKKNLTKFLVLQEDEDILME